MSKTHESARLVQWTKRGKKDWYIFYTDYTSARPHQKRVLCVAHGAFNAELRRALLENFRSRELLERAESMKQGGSLAFDTALTREINAYLDDVNRRGRTRVSNPDSRQGLSGESVRAIKDALGHFTDWLEQRGLGALKTGRISRQILVEYFDHLASKPGRRGNTEIRRSAATLNHHRRVIRACLNWINGLRPRRFPDFDDIKPAFRPVGGGGKVARAYAPREIEAFAKAAISIDKGDRQVEVNRTKGHTGKTERFEQAVHQRPATPLTQLFMLLALTGCRRQEALDLKWKNVDFERQGIFIHASKTGRERFVPLAGATEGVIAPNFLRLLKHWSCRKKTDFVLEHRGLVAPAFPKSAWADACKRSGISISPQRLRQNFTSYGASLGVPATTCALWQGHSSLVAERHYRALVPSRNKASSMEEAMGLAAIVEALLREA